MLPRRVCFLVILFNLLCCVHSANTNGTTPHPPTLCSQCSCLGGLSDDPFSVDCDNLNFHEVPQIWKDLHSFWRLTLNGNSITEIPVFTKVDNLTSLSFKFNKISKIADFAFQNLTNLSSLVISHNLITGFSLGSDTFKGLYHDKLPNPLPLKTLDLSYNKIAHLPKGVFHPFANLTSLDLSHNPIMDISIKTAEAFSELISLQTLYLSYTNLSRLPNHFFAELANLQTLDLSGNHFIVVPAEVNYARSLRTLIINDNLFGVISGDAFWESLNKLETLKLSKSETLFRIEDGAFGNLTSLRTLWLSDNVQLGFISSGAFSNKDNHTLSLKELHLENNDLDSLPPDALPWKQIRSLCLGGNPWNCDCKFEWLAKGVIAPMLTTDYDASLKVTCASPPELMGLRVTDQAVQTHTFVCNKNVPMAGAGIIIVATIVVGTLLLVTGTIIFSYILFRRTKVSDWIGNRVKYRRTQNEDEEVIASTEQY